MLEDWKTYKLGEVAKIKYGKDHKKLEEGSIPCYGTGGIMRYVDKFLSEEESVLIPRKGSLNKLYYINKPFWTVDTLFWTQIDSSKILPKFLYYNFKTIDFASKDVGSAVPSLTTSLLNKVDILLPPLPEQKAIASILSALDDKIELNHQMNKTLEEMAMALYKHWFVDFGPFQAGEFVDSELGKIPKGWEVKMFGDIVLKYIDNRGKTPPSVEDGIPLLEVKHISSNLFPKFKVEKYVTPEIYKSWFRAHLKSDDILISTVGTVGLTCLVPQDRPVCIAQNLLGVRFNNVLFPRSFMFYLMKSPHFLNQIENRLVITVQKSIKRKDLNVIPVIIPPEKYLEKYSKNVDEWIDQMESNILENQTLTQLRDTLLPKLISGEVRVNDAVKQIQEVV